MAMKDKPVSRAVKETLAQLLQRLEITEFDVLLVGDGSGSGWSQPCGWSCVSIERISDGEDMKRRVWYGACNNGTVNTAEGLAYFQPLNWLHSREVERCKNGAQRRIHRVHILTDSQYLETMGNGAAAANVKNSMLWAAYQALKRVGFVIRWHWVRRDTTVLNIYTDLLSKLARGALKQQRLVRRLEKHNGLSIHD